MKVRVYASIVLTGTSIVPNGGTLRHVETIILDCSFPVLPDVGHILELHNTLGIIEAVTVESVNWFPVPGKVNIFQACVYLKEDESFNKLDCFSENTTICDKREELFRRVKETQEKSNLNDLRFEWGF